MTEISDIVLIHFEGRPLNFARIEAIEPDVKRGWYQVKLMVLQLPIQVITWILRDAYINGEPFTMEGKQVRLERIVCPTRSEPQEQENNKTSEKKTPKNGKVISLADMKKK
jgi:hypothetical protein